MSLTFKEQPRDTGRVNRLGVSEYTRVFQVHTNKSAPPVRSSARMRSLVEQFRPDLRPFSPHPDDAGALVESLQCDRESRWIWTVTVPYTSDVTADELDFSQQPLTGPTAGDPTRLGTRVSVRTNRRTKLIQKDVNGKAIVNTAGDPILGVEVDRSYLEITVESDLVSVKSSVWDYADTINDSAVRVKTPQITKTFPKHTLRVSELSVGSLQSQGTTTYTTLVMRLEENRDTWKVKELNLGLRERLTTVRTDFLTHIVDGTGVPVSEPVFLDKKGHAYRDGIPKHVVRVDASDIKGKALSTNLKDSDIIILEFDGYEEKPFGQLNI